jgi:hypothetical protein
LTPLMRLQHETISRKAPGRFRTTDLSLSGSALAGTTRCYSSFPEIPLGNA